MGGDRRQKVAAHSDAFPPVADGLFVGDHGSADLALGLSFLVALPSPQPVGFFPIGGWPPYTVSNRQLYINGLLGGCDGMHEICKA
jgi:hypothetical protein